METFGFLAILLIWFLLVIALGRWTLRPVDLAARRSRAPLRFSVADFLSLVIVVQIPLAGVRILETANGEARITSIVLYVPAFVFALVVWFMGVKAVSRAQIDYGLFRVLFVAFVLPMTFYGVIPFATLAALAIQALVIEPQILRHAFPKFFVLEAARGAGLAASATITRKIVADRPATTDKPAADPVDGTGPFG